MMKILAISSVVGASAIQWIGSLSQACSKVYQPDWHAVAECIKHVHTAGGCDPHAGNDLDACVLQVTAGRSSSFVQADRCKGECEKFARDPKYPLSPFCSKQCPTLMFSSFDDLEALKEDLEDDDEESSFVQDTHTMSIDQWKKTQEALLKSLRSKVSFLTADDLRGYYTALRSSSFVEDRN